jgi:hypothetical protein
MEEKTYLNFFRLCDEYSVRIGVAAFAGIVYATARTVSGGTFYDLFAGVFFVFAVLAFTFLFAFATSSGSKNESAVYAGRSAFLFLYGVGYGGNGIFFVFTGRVRRLCDNPCNGVYGRWFARGCGGASYGGGARR